jgi:hypothetical protein
MQIYFIFGLRQTLPDKIVTKKKKISYLLTVPLLYVLGRILFAYPEPSSSLEVCVGGTCEAYENNSKGFALLLAQLLQLSPSTHVWIKAQDRKEEIYETLCNMNFTSYHVE